MTSWDDHTSDPIGDIKRMVEQGLNRPYRPPHSCEVDGHIEHFGSLRCAMCHKVIREELSEDERDFFRYR